MAVTSPSDLRVRLLRDYAALIFLKIAATIAALFLALQVVAPWLVDLHQTVALGFAGVLVLGCPLAVLYMGWTVWADYRRLKAQLSPSGG